jgi:hypothetical protein
MFQVNTFNGTGEGAGGGTGSSWQYHSHGLRSQIDCAGALSAKTTPAAIDSRAVNIEPIKTKRRTQKRALLLLPWVR